MIEISREPDLIVITARGTLDADDYERIEPRLGAEVQAGHTDRVLMRVVDFDGWTFGGMLEETIVDLRHRNDFDLMAVVGEGGLQKLVTKAMNPAFGGTLRFFTDETEARRWLHEAPTSRDTEEVPTTAKVLAGMLTIAGASKLGRADAMKEQFHEWGYSSGFMMAVGSVEILGAAGLLSPRTRRTAALGISALMGGAIATHIANGETPKAIPALGTLAVAASLATPS